MKTSELIKKLIEIDKTVPFDADIVQGDDFEYDILKSVHHNPPHTYFVFDTKQTYDQDDGFSAVEELIIRSHHTNEIKKLIEQSDSSKDNILRMLDEMSEKLEEIIESLSK